MNDGSKDDGLTANGLWAWAWVLGIVAVGSLLRMLSYAADGMPGIQAEFFVWVLLGTIAAAFSACCAVLAGIKAVEIRLTRRMSMPTEH